MTKVVNLRIDRYDIYIGRGSIYGNPIKLANEKSRASVLKRYTIYFYERLEADPKFKEAIHALKGKTLGCFCKPKACHGDIIAEYLNRGETP